MVCPRCHSIYEYDCFIVRHGQKESKLCSHVAYPNHSQCSKRRSCGATLLKKVSQEELTNSFQIKFTHTNCFSSHLVQKEGFQDACEKWRSRKPLVPDVHLADIYDGHVWSDFESSGFLEAPFCYLLVLNVDWFQPFTHIEYSVGAIYLTVQNLPRNERYKEENIILVGILPGSLEPPLTINSYLASLVEDL